MSNSYKFPALLAVVCWVFPGVVFSSPLSLRDAIDKVRATHPEIKSLSEQVDSLDAKSRQALAPSEPTLSISYGDTTSLFGLSSAASTVYQISQPIAFPGKAFLQRSQIKFQSRGVYHQWRAKCLAVGQMVRSIYNSLGLINRNQEINLDQKRSFERILEIAKRRYEAGSITQIDLMIAESNLYNNLNEMTDLKTAERATRAQLNLLLGNDPNQELVIDPLKMEWLAVLDPSATLQKMVSNQPEIQSALSQQESAERAYSASWMSLLPDFQIYVGTTYYNAPTGSPFAGASGQNHTYGAGVQLTVPIWALLNEREAIGSASHDRAAADANLHSQFLQSKTTLETTLHQINAFESKLKKYQEHLLPLAEQTLDLAMINYSSGKVDFQALSDAANNWRNAKTVFYTLVANYQTTYFSVGQLTGEEL